MNGICILQLQAKDVVDNNVEIKSQKRYKAVFDYSLESIKLNKVHKSVCRNNRFIFKNNGKSYTNDIISICFDYKHDKYSKKQLREKLYKDGFYCFGEHYVRYKRSSGSARVGKCLFIQEKFYKPMMEWSYMGLDFKEDSPVDLASKEAYVSLTTSSIIDTLEIHPEEILLINDYESVFTDRVVSVKENENFSLYANEEEVEIKNNIWDGQSLLDSSVFEKKYKDKGMLLLRNRFFKSCCFNTNIQKFFHDNDITDIKQLNGVTYAKDISQIKMITTPSSIKYLKFGTFDKWIKNLEPIFGIVKYDKPTHFFKGNLVQTHYQLINTLELSREEIVDFLSDSLNYVSLLKNSLPILRNHLKMKIDSDNDNVNLTDMKTSSDFIYNMLSINDDISKTTMFVNFKKELIKSFVNNMKKGHILINGNYSTILGNGYEMLLSSIDEFNGESILGVDEVVSKRFNIEEKLMGIRSPHVTLGNIWLVKNKYPVEYEKYFNLTNQILVINSIGSNVLNRLNGCD